MSLGTLDSTCLFTLGLISIIRPVNTIFALQDWNVEGNWSRTDRKKFWYDVC